MPKHIIIRLQIRKNSGVKRVKKSEEYFDTADFKLGVVHKLSLKVRYKACFPSVSAAGPSPF